MFDFQEGFKGIFRSLPFIFKICSDDQYHISVHGKAQFFSDCRLILGEIRLTKVMPTIVTMWVIPLLLVIMRKEKVFMGRMIWRAMYGNGQQIGMMQIIM